MTEQKRMRTARVFDLAFIGEAEVNDGAGDCLALGIGAYGETIAIVEQHNAPTLSLLRDEMESNPLKFVSIIRLTGENIDDRSGLDAISEMAGRHVDNAIQGIYAVRYFDAQENKVNVRVGKNDRRYIDRQPRFAQKVRPDFYCVSCRNAGGRNCHRSVGVADMEELVVGGRTMTLADCSECGSIMTRTGGIRARRERHGGLSERRLFFEPPPQAYCFSCERSVRMIWVKAVRHSDTQPRPSYRGNCASCLAMVGTPWQRTRLIPIKAKTVEKLVAAARSGEDALYERRILEAEKRRAVEREEMSQLEASRMQTAIARLKRRYRVEAA